MNDDAAADGAARWARTWHDAWEALDVEAIVDLYADACVFSSHPFRPPYRGRQGVRDYVSTAFAAEVGPRVSIAVPIVDGDRASISWWCALREDGQDATLAGTSVLRFDADGRVAEQWDAWNVTDEQRDPPSGWSPFADRDA